MLPCAVRRFIVTMPTWLSASKSAPKPPTIRSGGITKKGTSRFESMDAKYKGQCCDGTRKWGDGNPYKRSDGAMVYCCGACRQELPRPALTSEQMARIEANKAKALALRAAKQVTLALSRFYSRAAFSPCAPEAPVWLSAACPSFDRTHCCPRSTLSTTTARVARVACAMRSAHAEC